MTVLTEETKRRITEYHKYHGDKVLTIVKVVKDIEGYDAVLVRVQNKAGETYSCLDVMDLEGDYSELCSDPTEQEDEMVEYFINGE